jgi:DNA mismatch endonuclease (patch repair protein)
MSSNEVKNSRHPPGSDIYDRAKRSEVMSRVRSTNTKPELILRSLLHRAGYRFRLHVARLPGHPDIVLPKYRTVMFVHGCFWHQHPGCRRATIPHNRREWWEAKLSRNVERDAEVQRRLAELGWESVVVWECELGEPAALMKGFEVRLRRHAK